MDLSSSVAIKYKESDSFLVTWSKVLITPWNPVYDVIAIKFARFESTPQTTIIVRKYDIFGHRWELAAHSELSFLGSSRDAATRNWVLNGRNNLSGNVLELGLFQITYEEFLRFANRRSLNVQAFMRSTGTSKPLPSIIKFANASILEASAMEKKRMRSKVSDAVETPYDGPSTDASNYFSYRSRWMVLGTESEAPQRGNLAFRQGTQ